MVWNQFYDCPYRRLYKSSFRYEFILHERNRTGRYNHVGYLSGYCAILFPYGDYVNYMHVISIYNHVASKQNIKVECQTQPRDIRGSLKGEIK